MIRVRCALAGRLGVLSGTEYFKNRPPTLNRHYVNRRATGTETVGVLNGTVYTLGQQGQALSTKRVTSAPLSGASLTPQKVLKSVSATPAAGWGVS